MFLHKAERKLVGVSDVKSVRVYLDDVACIKILAANMAALFGHDQTSAEKHACPHALGKEWWVSTFKDIASQLMLCKIIVLIGYIISDDIDRFGGRQNEAIDLVTAKM